MTNKEAIFLLGACQPGGSSDPEFSEALAHAAGDPVLKAWYDDQRRFDRGIAAHVQASPVPVDLRARILAGARVSQPAPWASARRLWAIAAMLTIFAGIGLWYSGRQPDRWEDKAIATLSQLLSGQEKFDVQSSSVATLQQWLRANKAPNADDLPARVQQLASVGCKTISWRGHPISIICFHGPGGELVHLAMVSSSALESPPPLGHPVFETRDGWQMACWSQGDMSMMLVTKAPESQLRSLLSFIVLN